MSDLKGALLAAADEAEKMQLAIDESKKRIDYLEVRMVEQQSKIDNLEAYIEHVECENNKLRTKLKNAADYIRSVATILSDD
jgi:uncharacterized coiled-coil protein SlyX